MVCSVKWLSPWAELFLGYLWLWSPPPGHLGSACPQSGWVPAHGLFSGHTELCACWATKSLLTGSRHKQLGKEPLACHLIWNPVSCFMLWNLRRQLQYPIRTSVHITTCYSTRSIDTILHACFAVGVTVVGGCLCWCWVSPAGCMPNLNLRPCMMQCTRSSKSKVTPLISMPCLCTSSR